MRVSYFLQGGRIFPHLTVEENFAFAGMGLSKKSFRLRKEEMMSYFDLFKNAGNGRLNMEASYLSGGEQHQLALAMVVIKMPKFLILDEPSAGLSPGNVTKLYGSLTQIKDKGNISILLIEQNVKMAFEFSNTVLLLREGLIEKETMNFENIEEKYFK